MNSFNVVNIHSQIIVASFTYIIRIIINRLNFSIVQRLYCWSIYAKLSFFIEFMIYKPSQYKDWPIRLKYKMHKLIVLKKFLQTQKTTSKL